MGIYGMVETITKDFELSFPLIFLIIKWVGIIWCLLFVGKMGWAIYKYCFRKPYDLFSRYGGENIWAVVTGASDGIGLEYCRQLSRLGFNILMVARNRNKLEARRVEILEQCQGKIEVQIVEMDFNIQFSEESYAPVIEAIKEKQIAILVNNVGAVVAQDFHKFSEEKLLEMLNVNIESVTFMTRLILPGMVSRNPRKCGVICISDVLGQVPLPYAGTYASTKAYMSYFCNSLALEYKGTNIDFLNCLPGRVHTKLSPVKTNLHLAVEEAVKGQLRGLGHDSETFGNILYALYSQLFHLKPMQRQTGNRFRAAFQDAPQSDSKHSKTDYLWIHPDCLNKKMVHPST